MSFETSVKDFMVTSKDFITTNAVKGYTGFKQFIVWSGRSIQSGWNNHLVPKVSRAWLFVLPFLQSIGAFLQTGFGFATIGASATALVYILGHKYATSSLQRHAVNAVAAALLVFSTLVAAIYAGDAVPTGL